MRRSMLVFPLLFALAPTGCPAQQQTARRADCTVGRVSDGDSFRCNDGRRIRLIGIDSPESQQHPAGEKARAALLRLLPPGSTVQLETDITPTDRYGRTLAYVWSGFKLVNEAMVREGWAVLYTVPPNVSYAKRLEAAQKEARARGTGLWSQHGFDCMPSDFRRNRCLSPP